MFRKKPEARDEPRASETAPGDSGLGGVDADLLAILAEPFELDHPFDQGEQGVVLAAADIIAGMYGGAALAYQDRTGSHQLTIITLDAEAFAGAVATVA